MLLVGQGRSTNTSRATHFVAIAAVAIILVPAFAMAQGHGGGRGGGGPGGPGGAGAGGHTTHDDGHSGKKGGSDPTRGKGRAPSSLSDVFRGMEDEAGSKGSGRGGSPKESVPTVTKKAPPVAKGPTVSKKGPPEGKGPAAKSQEVVTEDVDGDDDSDRPIWAGGNPELNPHSGGGGGKPAGAGTKKGDLYGDLIMLKRDPETGEAETVVVNDKVEYLICLDAGCTETTPTVELEVPDGVTPIEVEFGRAAVARAPDKVIEKALTDALAKLTADGVVLGTEASGRITYTVDGTTSTIDSPLENLALYVDLLKGLASGETTDTKTALGDLATLETAAALFAGVADKTGDITIDYVYYQNLITGTADPDAADTYYDYSAFDYDRAYPTDYSYWLSIDGADPVSRTLDVNAYLEAMNGSLPTGSAALFAAAADDSLEVIELLHTQVHTEVLPGTTDAASN